MNENEVQTYGVEPEAESNGVAQNGSGGEQAEVILVKALYDTRREKLPEMSNIPLDKVRPLTWMLTYAREIIILCEEIVEAQKKLSKHYAKYHKGEVPPKVEWVDNWQTYKWKIVLLMAEWVYTYCQFRRSVGGDHMKSAVLLAQDQIAMQQGKEEESPWDLAKKQ